MRFASQAVPSPNPVGFYHCGAAIGSLIKKIGLVTCFYFARVQKRGLSACLNLSIGYADNGQPQGLSLQSAIFKNLTKLRADTLRPYTIMLICNIATVAYHRYLHQNPNLQSDIHLTLFAATQKTYPSFPG